MHTYHICIVMFFEICPMTKMEWQLYIYEAAADTKTISWILLTTHNMQIVKKAIRKLLSKDNICVCV